MRQFAFVVFDVENKICDRFSFNLTAVTDPSGLGWKLKFSTISGMVTDTLTKVFQEKQPISITINFVGRSYEKFNVFSQWLQKYSVQTARMALAYDDGVQCRYAEGKVKELKKTEKDEYGNLAVEVLFNPLTPFFVHMEQTIRIQVSDKGKCYSFKYPYSYGKNRIENDKIVNPYINDVPVTVKITGTIHAPIVELLDESGDYYNRVSFPNMTLAEGQYILINSAMKKIYYFNGSELQDFSAETDPRYDTFLFAKQGESRISVNLSVHDSGVLTGSWRQYGL